MSKIFINGKFLCQRVTGVQRYAIEIVKRLDFLCKQDIDISILIPDVNYLITHIELNNIKIITINGKPNYFWEQITLPRYCKKHKCDKLLNLCNVAPIFFPGMCTIHDVAYIDAKKGYNFKQVLIYKLINKLNAKRYKRIFTVSNTMKERIEKIYKVSDIIVTYNGYEHLSNVAKIKPEIDIPSKFYFSLGSINPNKNFQAIINLAKKNPLETFLIVGGNNNFFKKEKIIIPNNVRFTGYLKDEEISYLYQNCNAFLFPSNYEGFGIPPLEALINGCNKVICNDIPVLRELYSDYVFFHDFNHKDLNLNKIEPKYIDNEKLKSKFNWETSAIKIYNALIE